MLAAAVLALAGWLVLAASGFWLCSQRDDRVASQEPAQWPEVVAVVPARDEADVIARALASLARQDYPGPFRISLVDDYSSDGTAEVARGLGLERLTVLAGAPLAAGWTGKLWAVHQGIAAAGAPLYLWLTDADIAHAPDTLRRLVAIAGAGQRRLVSLMVRLQCETLAERALVPAFVWFFMMLYPFNWVNRRGGWADRIAGAAGGCVLVEGEALAAAGGIAAIKGALIDDCTLGRLIKRQGPIWLGLTQASHSLRPYAGWGAIAAMIARSAYAQLRYNPLLLALCVAGLGLVFGVPLWAGLCGAGLARGLGLATLALMVGLYQPICAYYRRSPLWGLALPLVAAFYTGCTLWSACAWYRGRGGMWKGRAQAGR